MSWDISYYQRNKPLNIKFWEKVEMTSINDCWMWKASKNKKGYGNFYVSIGNSKDKHILAHRMAYILWNHLNEIPDGLQVLHRCDNPSCCNPAHLFLGTNQDNMNDMMQKGRRGDKSGEHNSQAKLTSEDVFLMRNMRKMGMTYEKIAIEFGLHLSTVADICNGKSWKHLL